MALEVIGKLIEKQPAQQVTERFKKREFILDISEEVNGNTYANYAKMQLVQNRCEILDRFNEGDMVKVSFNIRGNRWERDGKVNYITSLDAWRIESAQAGESQSFNNQQSAPQQQFNQPASNNYGNSGGYSGQNAPADDLPF
jgi:single-stranded DNA-binding protein